MRIVVRAQQSQERACACVAFHQADVQISAVEQAVLMKSVTGWTFRLNSCNPELEKIPSRAVLSA